MEEKLFMTHKLEIQTKFKALFNTIHLFKLMELLNIRIRNLKEKLLD